MTARKSGRIRLLSVVLEGELVTQETIGIMTAYLVASGRYAPLNTLSGWKIKFTERILYRVLTLEPAGHMLMNESTTLNHFGIGVVLFLGLARYEYMLVEHALQHMKNYH